MTAIDRAVLAAELSTERVLAALDLSDERLDNGLRLIVFEDHRLPVAAVNLWYAVGSRNEEPGRTGFAHLFEHLMFEGSRQVAPGEHMALLRQIGGVCNASTSTDATDYWQVVPEHAVELALWLEADRMGSHREALTEERFEVQRGVVRNERRERLDNTPTGDLPELILTLLFPEGHPYRHSVIGSMDDLDAATSADAAAFHERWYVPDNASLVVAGDVDRAQVREWVTEFFGAIPAGGPRPAPPDGTLPLDLGGRSHQRLERAVPNPVLVLAFRAPPFNSAPAEALRLATTALASGRTSRLHERIVVQQELATSVSVRQGGMRYGTDMLVVEAAPRPGVPVDRLEHAVVEVLRSLVDEPMTEREMARLLPGAAIGIRRLREDVNGFAGTLNANAVHRGDPTLVASVYERFAAITPDQVAAVVADVVTDANRAVVEIEPAG